MTGERTHKGEDSAFTYVCCSGLSEANGVGNEQRGAA